MATQQEREFADRRAVVAERTEPSYPMVVELAIAEIVESLDKTGNGAKITVGAGRPSWGEDDGYYVTGYKPAALDRCARVTVDGEIEWIR